MALAGEAAARELQDVLNTGTLRVGVTLFAPWAARGNKNELVGFEVDVAQQLAADMGVKAQLLAYDVDRLVPALEAGEIDVIAAGLTITPERALHVNFSQPYAESGIALATHVTRTANVTDIGALDNEEFTIAAVEGSVGATLARRLWPRARVQTFTSVAAASEALLAGEVHGYVEDEPVPTFLALENPGVIDVPTARPLLASRAGFAVVKGDAGLPRVLECVDRRARSRHVAADDGELLVQIAAVAGAARRCDEALIRLALRRAVRGLRGRARCAEHRRAARAAHHRHARASSPRRPRNPPRPVTAPLVVPTPTLGLGVRPPNAARLAPLPEERQRRHPTRSSSSVRVGVCRI